MHSTLRYRRNDCPSSKRDFEMQATHAQPQTVFYLRFPLACRKHIWQHKPNNRWIFQNGSNYETKPLSSDQSCLSNVKWIIRSWRCWIDHYYKFTAIPQQVPVITQMNPVHKTVTFAITTAIISDLIRLSSSRRLPLRSFPTLSSQQLDFPNISISSYFPTKTVCKCHLSNARLIPYPAHASRFGHPNNVWIGVKIAKLLARIQELG